MQRIQQRVKKGVAGFAVAVVALLAGCGGGGQSLLAISPTAAQTIDAGTSLSILVSVVNDASHKGATYSLSGPGSVSVFSTGVTGSSESISVTYAAPATVTAATSTVFTATSVNTPSQTASLTININPALVITTASLPNGTQGTAYSATLASTGGTGAVKWGLFSGTLPTGVTLNAATGVLSGTPTASGTYSFSISATDSASFPATVTQAYVVTINPQPPVVTAATLPNGVVGTAYSQQLAYTGGGGTATFNITSGSLPASSGLTLSASGLISGTPTTASAGTTYSFSVAVTTGSQTSAPVAFTLTIYPLPAVTTTTLPSGNVGVGYSQQLSYSGGNGGTVSWAIVAGSLPAGSGLTLSSSGLLSGTPTTATTYSFSVAVTVGGQTSASQALTLVINSLIVTSGSTASGEVSLPFQFHLTAAGGTGPYTWSLATGSAALPAGLSLAASTGLISGTPTTAGTTTGIVVMATDSLGATATQSMTFTISAARGTTNNGELLGQYAFLLSGFDAAGRPLAVAGKLVADGAGNVASGTIDTNGTGQTAESSVTLLASAYSVGSDNRGKIALTTASGTSTFVISLNSMASGVAGGGTMTEFDASGQSLTGVLALQSTTAFTTASISGGFAFGLGGFGVGSTAAALVHRSIAGELQFNGTGGITSGELLSSASATATPTVATSAVVSVGATGRGTLALTLPSGLGTLNFAVYVVSSTKFFLLSIDPASGSSGAHDLLSGQALQQTTTNGNFNAASLNGVSVLRSQKLGTASSGAFFADVQLGLYSFGGAGTGTLAGDENAGGVSSSVALSGKYAVAANGRVTLTLAAAGIGGCTNCVSPLTYAYLVGANQGFVMDFSSGASSGQFEPQTATGITNATFTGAYTVGTTTPLTAGGVYESGVLSSTGSGSFTGTVDTDVAGTLTPDAAQSGTYVAAASGRVVLTQAGSTPVLYVVSATKSVVVDLSAKAPVVVEVLR